MKKVSVIVPFYNTEKHLQDCLNSILHQTYSHLEIILINDQSTDQSLSVAKELQKEDSRVEVIENETNMGVGYSRNIGLDQATGDYVYFVDSDDVIHEEAIRVLVEEVGDEHVIAGSVSTINDLYQIEEFEQNDEIQIKRRKTSKVFKSRSVLKGLYSLEFIREHNIRFYEDSRLYSDYTFMYKLIELEPYINYTRDSRYFRKNRIDRVTNPNLVLTPRYEKIDHYAYMFHSVKEQYEGNPTMQKLIDSDFLNFYRKTAVLHLKEPEDFNHTFSVLSEAFKQVPKSSYNKLNFILKKEINYLKQGDQAKFLKWFNLHDEMRLLKRGFKGFGSLKKYLFKRVFKKMDLKEQTVVFESFMGKSYGCNPKAIHEHMHNNNHDYQFIWIHANDKLDIPGKPKQIKRFSLAYYYYMARAKYWVFNTRVPKHVTKREDTILLQTWHGTPLKRLGLDIENVQMPGTDTGKYRKNFTDEVSRWDYLISPNQYSTDIFKRAFMFEQEMLETGYPRNDVLQQNSQERAERIKESLGMPKEKKVILYAPTWRDNQYIDKGQYSFELPLDLDEMQEQLSDDYVIVLKLHYLIANQLDLTEYPSFAFDLSKHDDIAELYLISDILITDYSSVFFDYANLRRPILFYTYDLEDYKDDLRGFYFDMETGVPGPLLKTNEEVIEAIENIEDVAMKYEERYEQFYAKFCAWEDGQASKKVIDQVFK
ncbi:CDP-glycerol glycerophosphotransferase [Alkalibacillus filiformis]|uniref:CDP-glycerol glycerophosphotransferase n=1 Tax=Alkalibacillus filiformis TaxID=200990 RepID=A0ABU0DWC2_9BACI|nr:CDP-glycerol:glycerophosphate glycerophosphotransferase [Alkalibacillus filiformis]MDQ0352773.1 CDP-glycerol glycerophosphotransferase [Alkalibacillus filiformis]